MKGIILAAGRGSRMGNVTDIKPKCLVEIDNRTLLDYQLTALSEGGVNDVAIVTGYKRQELQHYKLTQFHNPNWQTTNIVSSLIYAKCWLEKHTCIVSYSDIYYFPEAVKLLRKCPSKLAVTYDPDWLELWSERFDDPLDDAETFRVDSNSIVTEIGGTPKTTSEIQGQFMGLFLITPESWRVIYNLWNGLSGEEKKSLDITKLLSIIIKKNV